jgi:hypothetical protein
MVSFDIVSFFSRVPIKETMELLRRHFEEDVLGLFRHILTTSYFTFNGQFYGQTDGVAMGSLLSPVIANFYMEDYEKAALELDPLKPRCWFRYIDDTFVIWLHGTDKLKDFPLHLNTIHQTSQFIMETKSEGHLPYLDLDIYRRPDGSLGYKLYRKPTTPISTSTPTSIITHPINKLYCLFWCTGSELSVMKTACRPNWCS